MTTRNKVFTEADAHHILTDLIGSVMFTDLGVTLFTYEHSDRTSRFISYLCTKGYILESELEAFIHHKLIARARLTLKKHIVTRILPDHLYHGARILGYGIKHAFSASEIESISFERDETAEDYSKKSEGLLELCVDQILNRRKSTPPESFDTAGGGSCYCCPVCYR